MKTSLVLEIQNLATESSHDICDLLRKTLLVATKLKLDDFKVWVNNELNGYPTGPVPEYRKASAEVRLKNPYHGLIPVHFSSQETADWFSKVELHDPIGNLVSILKSKSDSKTGPVYPLTHEQEAYLINEQEGLGLQPIRTLSYSDLDTIIDAVRTRILEWTLKLEEEGILGEGMTFTNEEKAKAKVSQEIRIENFQGVLGNVDQSTITQNLTMNANDLEGLKHYIQSLGISPDDIEELETAIEEDPKPTDPNRLGPKVSAWIGRMVGKAASGVWKIGIAGAGNLLAKAICMYYEI